MVVHNFEDLNLKFFFSFFKLFDKALLERNFQVVCKSKVYPGSTPLIKNITLLESVHSAIYHR